MPESEIIVDPPWPVKGCKLAAARERTADRALWRKWIDATKRSRDRGPIRHSFEAGVRELQLRHHSQKPIAAIEGQLNRALRSHLETGMLVAFGRPNDVSAVPQYIPSDVWSALRVVNFRKSVCQEDREAHGRFADVRVYPVLAAPNTIELIAGRTLTEVFENFVFGDPEVSALSAEIVESDDPYRAFAGDAQAFPRRFAEWRVHLDDPTLLSGLYSGGMRTFMPRVPQTVSKAADALAHRFATLMALLRSGRIVARGLPRPGFPPVIPRAVWSREGFVLDSRKGDLLEENELSRHRWDRFHTRWTAIMLERPPTLENAVIRQPLRSRTSRSPKREALEEALARCGIDPTTTTLGWKAILGRLEADPEYTFQSEVAVRRMFNRLRG